MKLPLTVIVITKNEEENIVECLEQVREWTEEIIIVDSYSTDDTIKIAKNFTNRIFQGKFHNFKEKRQFGLKKATSPWVLFLDADERITPELAKEIEGKVLGSTMSGEKVSHVNGYYIPFKHFFMKRWLQHGGWYPSYLPRLAKREMCVIENAVHELLVIKGETGKLQNPILHYGDKSLTQRVNKTNFYTTLQARENYAKKKRGILTIFLRMCVMPIRRFIITYIVRRGFLDGVPGLIRALLLAGTTFMIHAKQIELLMRIDKEKGKDDTIWV